MQDNTDDSRLLLGLAGWPHPAWQGRYFPDELPPDWQFAYYSNDADCLLLSAAQWHALGAETLEGWLDDVEEHFRFYLRLAGDDLDVQVPAPFADYLGGLLVDDFLRLDSRLPQFRQTEDGSWADAQGVVRVCCLASLPADLRAQRALLQRLPGSLRALIVSDPAADPRMLGDLRAIAELLGVA